MKYKVETQITEDFLKSKGWILVNDLPLCQEYTLKNSNNRIKLKIGSYGGFSVAKYHWCNVDQIDEIISLNNVTDISNYNICMSFMGIYNAI